MPQNHCVWKFASQSQIIYIKYTLLVIYNETVAAGKQIWHKNLTHNAQICKLHYVPS